MKRRVCLFALILCLMLTGLFGYPPLPEAEADPVTNRWHLGVLHCEDVATQKPPGTYTCHNATNTAYTATTYWKANTSTLTNGIKQWATDTTTCHKSEESGHCPRPQTETAWWEIDTTKAKNGTRYEATQPGSRRVTVDPCSDTEHWHDADIHSAAVAYPESCHGHSCLKMYLAGHADDWLTEEYCRPQLCPPGQKLIAGTRNCEDICPARQILVTYDIPPTVYGPRTGERCVDPPGTPTCRNGQTPENVVYVTKYRERLKYPKTWDCPEPPTEDPPPTTTTQPPSSTTTTTVKRSVSCRSGTHKHGLVAHRLNHDSCHSHSCRWAGEHSSKAAHAAGVLHDGPCGGTTTTTTTTTVPDDSVAPTPTTTVPDCDANEELVNGVCVPVCVWGHDHGLGCHPPTNPPCSYASESGTGRHWHGWHHSSCHNQEPPCPTGQHRHGDGRKSTYRPGSHPHWSDECHTVLPDCNTVQHRHGNGREATYLGLYTHRAGSESHYSDGCHTVGKKHCDAGKHRHGTGRKATFTQYSHRAANSLSHWSHDCHPAEPRYCDRDAVLHRHNTVEGEATNFKEFRHPHYPDPCHPDDPKPICGEHEHIHSDANSYSTNEHLPGTLFKHWKVECHIDWACDPRPNTASHDPLYDTWKQKNPGYRWREPTWKLWGHFLVDDRRTPPVVAVNRS